MTSVRNVLKTFVLQDLMIIYIYIIAIELKRTIYSMVLLNETKYNFLFCIVTWVLVAERLFKLYFNQNHISLHYLPFESIWIIFSLDISFRPHACCHLFMVGGLCASVTRIAMLGGVFILLLGPPKPDRLKDRGQTK